MPPKPITELQERAFKTDTFALHSLSLQSCEAMVHRVVRLGAICRMPPQNH